MRAGEESTIWMKKQQRQKGGHVKKRTYFQVHLLLSLNMVLTMKDTGATALPVRFCISTDLIVSGTLLPNILKYN
jgi:hypothetical protein